MSESLSLKRDTSIRPVQRWEFETKLVPQSFTAADLFVHITLHGNHTSFDVAMPQVYGSKIVANRSPGTGSVSVNGVLGDRTVTLTSITGVIPKGLFIKFANHSKIYMVEEARDGNGVLKIFPGLVANVPQNTLINAGDIVKGSFLYDLETVIGMSFIDGVLMDNGTIKLVEAL
jgi:hypothetical protein